MFLLLNVLIFFLTLFFNIGFFLDVCVSFSRSRKKDKLRYRYPRGESYLDVIQRFTI